MKIMIDRTEYVQHILDLINDEERFNSFMDYISNGKHSHFKMGFVAGLTYAAAMTEYEREYVKEDSDDTEFI